MGRARGGRLYGRSGARGRTALGHFYAAPARAAAEALMMSSQVRSYYAISLLQYYLISGPHSHMDLFIFFPVWYEVLVFGRADSFFNPGR